MYPENQYLFQEDIYSANVFNGLWFLVRQQCDKILTKSLTTNIPQIQCLNLLIFYPCSV